VWSACLACAAHLFEASTVAHKDLFCFLGDIEVLLDLRGFAVSMRTCSIDVCRSRTASRGPLRRSWWPKWVRSVECGFSNEVAAPQGSQAYLLIL
jgi:hypothetical protein